MSTTEQFSSSHIDLRDYQIDAVNKSMEALEKHGNTLLVAPTGAGKAIILSSVISKKLYSKEDGPKKALVLQHRKEILNQNMQKLNLVSSNLNTSVVDAEHKDFSGDAVFAMVQTLNKMPGTLPHFDLVVVDEAHHVAAKSYGNILNRIKERNDHYQLYGVTATPVRGDKKRLNKAFNNIAYEIPIHQLIARGYLVKPRTFVIDIGLADKSIDYSKAHKTASDSSFDKFTTELLMSSQVSLQDAVTNWQKLATGRKTVFFTPSNQVSNLLAEAFISAGISAKAITHTFNKKDREALLDNFENGDIDILCNTMLLTEGWDCPKVSCIALLKTSCFKSTYLQMVGRGLRSFTDKQDCIVLDFGGSSFIHGTLDQDISSALKAEEELKRKVLFEESYTNCPSCEVEMPKTDKVCTNCGWEREEDEKPVLKEFSMIEIDFLQHSGFVFESLDPNLYCVNGFERFCFIKQTENGTWSAIGGVKNEPEGSGFSYRKIHSGSRIDCFKSGEDFMYQSANYSTLKYQSWLRKPVSGKQMYLLKKLGIRSSHNMNQYTASCWITYGIHQRNINKHF